jgi:hypothetical protein
MFRLAGLVNGLVLLGLLQGCGFGTRLERADPRMDRPAPRVIKSDTTLAGQTPPDAKDIAGQWTFSTHEPNARMEHGLEPHLAYGMFLKLEADGRYELVYWANWGTRGSNSPSFAGVDVRESGRFSLSGEILLLEPETTSFARKTGGTLHRQSIANERRAYLIKRDKAYLNIAGRCAGYQVEPICRDARDVGYSLRWGYGDLPPPLTHSKGRLAPALPS